MQALILAAGMGKRLGKYTRNNTKCMLKVDGKTLIERAIESLLDAGVSKLILVVGYKGENVKNYLLHECDNPRIKRMKLIFIENPIFDRTNNIYSLSLAIDEFKKDDTILLESDLIYDPALIKRLVDNPEKNLVTVARYQQWMDGTVVKVCREGGITEFIEKKDFVYDEIDEYYKTVNIYKFSKDFINDKFIPFLRAYIEAYGENEYYELVLKVIANISRSDLRALDVSDLVWYEIDDSQDLDIVNCLFSDGQEKLDRFQRRYGGYWRFEDILDYCYLVNPYYPTKKLLDKINYFSRCLITQYPSGQNVNCICASRIFSDVNTEYLAVGNGAAELISVLGRILSGKMFLPESAFNEYVRCFDCCELDKFSMAQSNYCYNVDILKDAIYDHDILCVVNPDNPTGAFIEENDMISLLDLAKKNNKIIIFDESFIDFSQSDKRYTFINDGMLEAYPNLIVVKSISKSYGVPGIRLGVLASSNKELIKEIKQKLPVWNINSYGEYFLQIANLYKSDYSTSCDKIAEERERMRGALKKVLPKGCCVFPSEANFLMADLGKINSTDLTIKLLNENIFIKDLRTKSAFEGKNFIRLAIRTKEENDRLIQAIKNLI
ncbi:aminotransferase class I/II-fold pyridoxal phosphate-dependent enzyme [Candidatus Saccharibacteria bacterium]|nr:aminotransferase class I/II-fold pyridoxal phosphate-dependent enzyme [Candidatus Saccharibacteria bacterium]MBQ6313424.1 aminotransferase class I/II-fold pyridoxal phosphate-dependent enzyme [Candidatus Saccharibacteria bacterium]